MIGIKCCKDCKKRSIDCHSNCERYKEEKKKYEEDVKKKKDYEMKHKTIPKGRFLGDYYIAKSFKRKSID